MEWQGASLLAALLIVWLLPSAVVIGVCLVQLCRQPDVPEPQPVRIDGLEAKASWGGWCDGLDPQLAIREAERILAAARGADRRDATA